MAEFLTKEQLRKQNIKLAFGVWGKSILASILGIVLYLSLGMISTMNQDQLGYRYYTEPLDFTGPSALYEASFARYDEYHLSEDGKTATLHKSYVYDTETHQYVYSEQLTAQTKETMPVFDKKVIDKRIEEKDETVGSYSPIYREKTALKTAMDIVSQAFMLLLLAMLVYTVTWQQGDKDRNTEDFGRMQRDKWRGLKIGLLASIPSGVMVLLLFVSRLFGLMPNYIFVYRLGMLAYAPINNVLSSGTAWTANVTWWLLPVALLCWTVIPLVTHIGYQLGHRQYSIGEHFIYKNIKKK